MLVEGRAVSKGTQLERIQALETENGFVFRRQDEMHEKLDKLILAVNKIDTTLDDVNKRITKMEPHTTTVANAKTFWAWTGKITAYTTAIGAAGYTGWIAIKPWLIWAATGK